MIISKSNLLPFVLTLLFEGLAVASPGDIRASLGVDRSVYRVGEEVRFTLTYRNISKRTLRFLPTAMYPAESLKMVNTIDKRSASLFTVGEDVIDFETLKSEVKILRPGDSITREIRCLYSTNLQLGEVRKRGLLLVFPGSALVLPSRGMYRISARYTSVEHPVAQYYQHEPKLWEGAVSSNEIVVRFN